MFASSLTRLVSSQPYFLVELSQLTIKNVPAELVALINDTTGTLIASNYVDPNTKIAVIFGTGCNAAYMETAEAIPKMSAVGLPNGQGMAINVGHHSHSLDMADHAY
jgi:hexokinase